MARAQVTAADGRTIELRDDVLAPFESRLDGPEPAPTRLAYAAARLVFDDAYGEVPHSLERPGDPAEIAAHVDWDATAALRRRLDALGFGIAEAMDTAQRFDVGWRTAEELIHRTGALGLANGFVAGAGVDHLDAIAGPDDLVEGVVHQARAIRSAGGETIVLPLVWLATHGCDEATYVDVYARIVERLEGPLYVHWLGEMFLPELAGYFPGESFRRVMELDPDKVRGAKLSLLDDALEVRLRRELLERDQLLLTGDDFHFGGLVLGGDGRSAPAVERTTSVGARTVPLGDFSHALLGVLDGVARPASLALRFLARDDVASYRALIDPCEELGRWLFQAPTRHYKAGLAFLAWLNGDQSNASLANHEERARDRAHYERAAELASRAGVLVDAPAAAVRLREHSG